jgi:hypothetical protein
MTPEEYAARQAVISAVVARFVMQFGQFFTRPLLGLTEWLNLLGLLFPEVQRQREESAALAREFYDSQRELAHPELPLNERLLVATRFEQFVENMEPARKRMSREDSPDDALASLALRAVREVENAGRRQIISAVEEDPAPRIIRGWARVATGRETCAWCLMLISRGPVYHGAERAGLKIDDTTALAAFRDAPDTETFFKDIEGEMEQWHDGCDCKVVPVFKQEGWFGETAAKRALELWKEATETAIAEEDLGKVHKSGKKKGRAFTRNQLAINALRRRLENGDITSTEWAAVAAA